MPPTEETITVFLPYGTASDDVKDVDEDPLTAFCRAPESRLTQSRLPHHHSTHGLHVIRWAEQVPVPLYGWQITVSGKRRAEFERRCRQRMWPYLIRLTLAFSNLWAWYRQPETWVFAFDPCDGTMDPTALSFLQDLRVEEHVGHPPFAVTLRGRRLHFATDRIDLLPAGGSGAHGLVYPVSPVALRRMCLHQKMILLDGQWQPPSVNRLRMVPSTLVAFVTPSSSSSSAPLTVSRPDLKYFAVMLSHPSCGPEIRQDLLRRLNGLTGVPPMSLDAARRWLQDTAKQ